MHPTLGLVFEHTKWLDENRKPLLMRVTKIARDTVYYRALDGSFPSCCDAGSFGKYARPSPNLCDQINMTRLDDGMPAVVEVAP